MDLIAGVFPEDLILGDQTLALWPRKHLVAELDERAHRAGVDQIVGLEIE